MIARDREEEKHIRNSIKCERLVNLGGGEEEENKEEGKVKRLAHLLEGKVRSVVGDGVEVVTN